MKDSVTHDLNGREYARANQVKPGSILEPDCDFACMKKGERKVVEVFNEELFIPCDRGKHFLAGQLNFQLTHYVGLYFLEP